MSCSLTGHVLSKTPGHQSKTPATSRRVAFRRENGRLPAHSGNHDLLGVPGIRACVAFPDTRGLNISMPSEDGSPTWQDGLALGDKPVVLEYAGPAA
jgi:hypothetical protein